MESGRLYANRLTAQCLSFGRLCSFRRGKPAVLKISDFQRYHINNCNSGIPKYAAKPSTHILQISIGRGFFVSSVDIIYYASSLMLECILLESVLELLRVLLYFFSNMYQALDNNGSYYPPAYCTRYYRDYW